MVPLRSLSESDRVILWQEIKELTAKRHDLEFEINSLEHDRIQQDAQYQALKQKYARWGDARGTPRRNP